MSQHFRPAPLALSAGLVLAFAFGCGHSARFEEAFEQSKTQTPSASGGTGNTGNGGSAGSASGSAGMMPMAGSSTGGSSSEQFACIDVANQHYDPATMNHYEPTKAVTDEVARILGNMNLDHKIMQMMGVDVANPPDYFDIERSPDTPLPDGTVIRGYNYRDAGHGVNLDAGQHTGAGNGARASDGKDYSTVFPTSSLRAASWDLDLERRVGEALGDETAASRNNMLLAPCMNIIRHPFWGRTQETYSEDMYHIGRFAAAFTTGLQKYVVGCAKHFAANNIEYHRSQQDAEIDSEQTLREIYGRHFEMVIQDGGMGCIMASYNMINGVKSTQNPKLLTDILRKPLDQGGMAYRGLVLSDWWAMPGDQQQPGPSEAYSKAVEAANAGLDIEVPWTYHYNVAVLTDAFNKQEVSGANIDEHARRVLEQKVRFNSHLVESPWGLTRSDSTLDGASIATNMDHEALAEESAIKSAVLLKNGGATPVLPLPATVATIGVVGLTQQYGLISTTPPKGAIELGGGQYAFNFAVDAALGDRGSSRVNGDPARTIGPTAGIAAVAGAGVTVTPYTSANYGNPTAGAAEAAAAVGAANPDTIVVVIGYTPGDEGEEYAIQAGGDRTTLNAPAGHNELVDQVLALMKPTIIVIEAGSIVATPWLNHANQNQATIWLGYPGVRGGPALGKLIFAKDGANFSGKMPMAWPASDADLVGNLKDTDIGKTAMGYFFGYREYDRLKEAGTPKNLAFPFGHGMSYSTFSYGNLMIPCTDAVTNRAIVDVTVEVTNTAGPAGEEVAMLFVKPPPKPASITGYRPVKELKSFAKVPLMPGEKKTVHLPLRIQDLRRWEGGPTGRWVIDPGDYTILVGPSGDDAELTQMGTLKLVGG